MRTATLRQREDWGGSSEHGLGRAHGSALASVWRADARDEHAAIASFHRFALDLLALGAPPELVADATGAARDEIEHARFVFRVASELDAQALGPDRLDLAGLSVRGDLREAVVAAIQEGCVGETLAAVCVGAAARSCSDPGLADQLAAIADDEARHAELAWRFVGWALQCGGPEVADLARRTFAAVLHAGATSDERELLLAGVPDDQRVAAGRLRAGESDLLRRRALDLVVAPCAKELLGNLAA